MSGRSAFGTHLTTVTYGFHEGTGLSRKDRLREALRDAGRKFPTNMGINASYPRGMDSPSDSPIEVRVSIKTSDVPRYYR